MKHKVAMAVPIPENLKRQMAQEGIYVLLNANPELPNMSKAKIKKHIQEINETGAAGFFANMDPDTILQLPYVYKPNEESLVEVDGTTYYVVSVKESKEIKKKQVINGVEYLKGSAYPGEVVLLDIESGEPISFTFDEVKDKIQVPSYVREETFAKVNKEIKEYNKKIDSIQKASGPTRLNLQIAAAEDRIKERISSLENMKINVENMIQNPEDVSPSYSNWIDFLKNNWQTFGAKDVFDTLMFLNQTNPQGLINKIQNNEIEIPNEIKDAVLGIAAQEAQMLQEKQQLKFEREQEKEQAMEEMLPESKEVQEEHIKEYEMEDIPETKYTTPKKYRTLHHWVASLNFALTGIKKDKEELEKIISTFDGLRKHIAEINKSKEYLGTPEGKEALDDIRRFTDVAQTFLKRYKENIVQNGKINPQLMGREGTVGNALIAVRLYNIYNVIKRTLDDIDFANIEDVQHVREQMQPADELREAYSKDKINKISQLLWQAFENRNKIR